VDINNIKHSWGVVRGYRKYTYFGNANDIKKTSQFKWFFPYKFNHPGFDAIVRVSEHHVRFVQITIAKTHSSKINETIPFIEAMDVHVVDFVFVCQNENFKDLTWQSPVNETAVRNELDVVHNKKMMAARSSNNIPLPAFKIYKLCYTHKNSFTIL